MCLLCEGGSLDELFADYAELIDEYGFTMVHVGAGVKSWTYTIGLLEQFGHPELVVTTLAGEPAGRLITEVVDRIREGEYFDASSRESMIGGREIRFGKVHPTQWVNGRFNGWVNYYGHLGTLPAEPEAVQVLWPNEKGVFPPDRDFCHDHRHCQPLLAFPVASDVNAPPHNRRRGRRR